MRTPTALRLFTLAAIIVTGVIWWHERAVAAGLQGRIAAGRQARQQLPGLRAERERLRAELSAAAARAGVARTTPADDTARPSPAPVEPVAWAVGEWTPPAEWRNEGRSTPRAATATMLWAAAGGDLAALQAVLEFDDATRARARTWFDTLPSATRALYATPENLVASMTIKHIAQTAAQLSWFNQLDPDYAIVGVQLAAPESPVPAPAPVFLPAVGDTPPSLANQSSNQLAVLTLHRTPAGWQVIVPVSAIDHMAYELSTPPKG